jgi:hypothetical protein
MVIFFFFGMKRNKSWCVQERKHDVGTGNAFLAVPLATGVKSTAKSIVIRDLVHAATWPPMRTSCLFTPLSGERSPAPPPAARTLAVDPAAHP